MAFWHTLFRTRTRPPTVLRTRLCVELLESRLVPYVISSGQWPVPQLVTLSFVPDGTILGSNSNGYIYSNLFATLNAKYPTATWEKQILMAAATWAQATNVNIAVVPDNGAPLGSGNNQQGDPNFGDIRIAGFNFNNLTLAMTDLSPPVNNYSIAGDVTFNTGQPYNIGQTYDLNSVALHELGHSFGLGESLAPLAVMFPIYTIPKHGLNADDLAGIQAIYNGKARSPDEFGGANNSFATAANISSQIDPNALTALLPNLDVNAMNNSSGVQTSSGVEYFTLTAPGNASNTMQVEVQSAGLSLLSPSVTVYAADQRTILASASATGQYGATLTLTVSNVTPNEQFYIKVIGSETTALGSGEYALALSLGGDTLPTVPIPVTTTPNGNPISSGGGQAQLIQEPSPAPTTARATLVKASFPATALGGSASFVVNHAGVGPFSLPVAPRPAEEGAGIHLISGDNPELLEQPLVEEDLTPDSQDQSPSVTVEPVAIPQELGAWQRACEACFAESAPAGPAVDNGAVPIQDEGADEPGSAEGAAAVLALALGGYWGMRPEEEEKLRARRTIR